MPKPDKGTKIVTHTKYMYIMFFERVYTKLAFYLAKVGDKTDEFSEADQIYREVELNHKRAMAEYEKDNELLVRKQLIILRDMLCLWQAGLILCKLHKGHLFMTY